METRMMDLVEGEIYSPGELEEAGYVVAELAGSSEHELELDAGEAFLVLRRVSSNEDVYPVYAGYVVPEGFRAGIDSLPAGSYEVVAVGS